ncbi:MAG TPA: PH domain-containing protein [Microbacteriaceae bacterium]|nr:PH domain-containing protein [Microbacteriaceae bacterium]
MSELATAGQAWQRVSPRYVRVELLTVAIPGLVVTGGLIAAPLGSGIAALWALPVAAFVIVVLLLVFTPRRVRSIGYQLREDDLVFRRGIMWHRVVAVPYGRMQLVDVNRGPIARAFGLAELKFVTAAVATGVVIPGLPEADAEALRDRLVALAESRRAAL